LNYILVAVSLIINFIAESSLLPVLIAYIFFLFSTILIYILGFKRIDEFYFYTRLFIFYYIVVGLSSLYRNYLNDPQGDGFGFYMMAEQYSHVSLFDMIFITEGSLAVYFWGKLITLFKFLEIELNICYLINLNTIIVAIAGLYTLRITRNIYGEDVFHYKLLLYMFSCCGLFWLFSSTLHRDCFVLLFVILLIHFNVVYLKFRNFKNIINIIIYTIIFSLLLFALRKEFIYLPSFLFLLSSLILLFSNSIGLYKKIFLTLMFSFIFMTVCIFAVNDIINVLYNGYENYKVALLERSSSSSLGSDLILRQPFYIRFVIGTIYLYIFPLPFWSGLDLPSAYHLFKSLNVLFMYTVLPLFILGLSNYLFKKNNKNLIIMFLFLTLSFFSFVICMTSLETRHLGAFYAPLFILSLNHKIYNKSSRINIFIAVFLFFSLILILHVSWLIFKVL